MDVRAKDRIKKTGVATETKLPKPHNDNGGRAKQKTTNEPKGRANDKGGKQTKSQRIEQYLREALQRAVRLLLQGTAGPKEQLGGPEVGLEGVTPDAPETLEDQIRGLEERFEAATPDAPVTLDGQRANFEESAREIQGILNALKTPERRKLLHKFLKLRKNHRGADFLFGDKAFIDCVNSVNSGWCEQLGLTTPAGLRGRMDYRYVDALMGLATGFSDDDKAAIRLRARKALVVQGNGTFNFLMTNPAAAPKDLIQLREICMKMRVLVTQQAEEVRKWEARQNMCERRLEASAGGQRNQTLDNAVSAVTDAKSKQSEFAAKLEARFQELAEAGGCHPTVQGGMGGGLFDSAD